MIAVFRDVGAPARLTRLVAGGSAAQRRGGDRVHTVLLGIILSGGARPRSRRARSSSSAPSSAARCSAPAGRALLSVIPWTGDDRLAEGTLTVALAYLAFIAAQRLFDVSGVVAVLAAGLTVSAFGRTRIAPYNWSFLTDLWEQIAFWAHSLVFLLASILVPKLLFDMDWRELGLIAVLIVAAFGARLAVLFLLMPLLSLTRLTQPVSTVYKLAIAWGGLRGALTLVLALSVTENPLLPGETRHFVAVLATGLVLFTLLVNGTTLRPLIRLLGLDRLSPIDRLLRDRVLELSYAETSEMIVKTAEAHGLHPKAVPKTRSRPIGRGRKPPAPARLPKRFGLTEHERMTVALIALGNQERMLVLETLSRRAASPAALQMLMRNADALVEGARERRAARLQARRGGRARLPPGVPRGLFRLSPPRRPPLSRRPARRPLRDAAGDAFAHRGPCPRRRPALALDLRRAHRQADRRDARDAPRADQVGARRLRRQYQDYAAALEARFLRQSALRRELGRYESLYEGGLIPAEVYRDLANSVERAQSAEAPPRFDIGLDTGQLVARLDLFAGLDAGHLERVQKLFEAPFHRAERAHRAQGPAGRCGVLHRLRRGRGGDAGPPHPARQRRRLRRDGAPQRRADARLT